MDYFDQDVRARAQQSPSPIKEKSQLSWLKRFVKEGVKKNETRLNFLLCVFACVLTPIILFYCFVIPQTPGRMTRLSATLIDEMPFWSFIASLPFSSLQSSELVAGLLIICACLAFTAYGLAIFFCWGSAPNKKSLSIIIISALVFLIISTFAFPNLNTDIYHYITRARVAAVHDSNPHYVPSDAFPNDPIYPYASHRFTGLVGDKLAMWTLISIPVAKIAGDNPIVNLLAFRITFLLFNAANIALIVMILRKLNPKYLMAGVLIYAWNPIVSIQGQSKSDTVMIFFLLLSILLLVVERKRLASISMASSFLVKLMTLPLVAVYLLRALILRRWRELAITASFLTVTVLVINAPFWEGMGLIKSHWVVAKGEASGLLPPALRFLIVPVFLLFFLWLGYLQDGSHKKLLLGWALMALCMSLFLVRIHNSWYHLTLIAVASVSLNWRIVLPSFALTFSAFLFNTWYSTFTTEFRVPELSSIPTLLVYLAPACLVILCLLTTHYLKNKGSKDSRL